MATCFLFSSTFISTSTASCSSGMWLHSMLMRSLETFLFSYRDRSSVLRRFLVKSMELDSNQTRIKQSTCQNFLQNCPIIFHIFVKPSSKRIQLSLLYMVTSYKGLRFLRLKNLNISSLWTTLPLGVEQVCPHILLLLKPFEG